eukprot:5345953-Pleurochrysis_carterae.AAC.1
MDAGKSCSQLSIRDDRAEALFDGDAQRGLRCCQPTSCHRLKHGWVGAHASKSISSQSSIHASCALEGGGMGV